MVLSSFGTPPPFVGHINTDQYLHYGRDSLIGIALVLSHMAQTGMSAKTLRNSYPQYHISKNKIELTPEIDVDLKFIVPFV